MNILPRMITQQEKVRPGNEAKRNTPPWWCSRRYIPPWWCNTSVSIITEVYSSVIMLTEVYSSDHNKVKENRQNEAAKKEMGLQLRKSKAWFGKSRDPQGFLWTWAKCSPQSWRKVFSHAFRVVRLYCSVETLPSTAKTKLLQVRDQRGQLWWQ